MAEKREGRRRDLSPSEVAGLIGVHVSTVRRACAAGEVGYRFGGRWYIPREQIEELREGGGRDRRLG